jgi:WD40 repeat protein
VLLADRVARVIDTHRGAVVSSFALDGDLEDAQLSADGNIVLLTARVTTSPSHVPVALQLRSATTGSVIRALSFTGDLTLSPTGDRLALTSDTGVEVVDTASGKTLAHVGFDRMPGHVTFDRDGKRLIGYGAMTHPRIVDATTGRMLTELGKPSSELECVSFDASGDHVVTWGDDRAAELWNARTGELLATIDGVAFCAIAISPDGLRVATAIDDGTIEIFDVTTLRHIDTLPVQQTGIDHLAWNSDSTRLVARASDTGITTIWDVHLETRSPQTISALVARTTGWQFAGGRLAPMR